MPELGETVTEALEHSAVSRLHSVVALFVAVAATLIALSSLKDRNLTLGMAQAQAQAVDTWNYYQAKSTKQNLAEATLDELTVHKSLATAAAPVADLDKKIEDYRKQVTRYDHEKAEIKEQAEGYERRYEALNERHDLFDFSEAGLSVAVALLGVTALTRKRWLLAIAMLFFAAGTFFSLAGFLNWQIHTGAFISWLA